MFANKVILAIESSCDEFSLALVKNNENLYCKTYSQAKIFSKYGGVVPEIASRNHLRSLSSLLNELKYNLNFDLKKIDFVACTIGPGLSGSLLVGLQLAKVISLFLDIPFIPVNHILGHVFSPFFDNKIKFPYMSLVVSGGHSEFIYLPTPYEAFLIGKTKDDAIGEVYDKIANKLGYLYPGGPKIDEISKKGNYLYEFPKVMLDEKYDFSFSGIKSFVINKINTNKNNNNNFKFDIACSLQTFVCDLFFEKIKKVLEDDSLPFKTFSLTGGVSANSGLRKMISSLNNLYKNIDFVLPDIKYTGDNASMIAIAASYSKPLFKKEDIGKFDIYPSLSIENYFSILKKFN